MAAKAVGADTSSVAESSERKSKPKVTAFVLDPDHVQASDDGMTVPPLPGLWRNDVAIHPEALGLTVSEMRDAIDALSLPLKEVKVAEGKAETSFRRPDYLLPAGPLALRGDTGGVRDDAAAVDEQAEIGEEHVDTTIVENETAAAAAESEGSE